MNEEQKPGIEKDEEICSQGEPHLSRPRNTYTDASWMSKMFFAWPQKLLENGMRSTIEEWDLPSLMDEETSARNREIFESIWKDEIDRVEAIKARLPLHSKNRQTLRPSLRRAVIKEFFRSTWIVQPLMCAASAARIVMAVALGNLIQSFIDKSKEGYFWAGVLVFCNTVVLFEHHHVFFITWRKGMQFRIAAIASIFAKSLRMNSIGSSNSISSGQVMNLVSNDVERFLLATLFSSYIIWAPLQTIAILIVGMYLFGPAFAVGVALLVFVFIPLQYYFTRRYTFLRSKVMQCLPFLNLF